MIARLTKDFTFEAATWTNPGLREFKDDAAGGIHHTQVVMAFGPVHRTVVSESGINRGFGIGRGWSGR